MIVVPCTVELHTTFTYIHSGMVSPETDSESRDSPVLHFDACNQKESQIKNNECHLPHTVTKMKAAITLLHHHFLLKYDDWRGNL